MKKLFKFNSVSQRLKRLLLIMIMFIGVLSEAKAQPPINPIHEADSILRALFSPICHPNPGPNFLYEMAVHNLDSIYFTDNNPDTLNRDTWFKLYEELRNGAYDTTIVVRHDTIYTRGMQWQKDTVVMNILAYNILMMNDTMFTDEYFDYDTVNMTITEKYPCEINPFITQRVFASCPIQYYVPYKQFDYRIDTGFIFHDVWNDIVDSNWMLQIDFGDGTGWHNYNCMQTEHYSVSYATSGLKYIKTRVVDAMMNVLMSSIAEISVGPANKPPVPDGVITLPGLTASVFNPCTESGEPMKKIVIYLEGFDPGDLLIGSNRTGRDIYQEMIANEKIAELQNFGYTFVVVDWVNSRQDIIVNAAYVEGLLNYLKCQMINPMDDTHTNEQFVIIGESMGGLVARYALCDMEHKASLNALGGCLPQKIHNTRLLFTFDSPNQGVNIPLAYQHLYRDAGLFLLGGNSITQSIVGGMSNILLDATSVKQMLLYHVDTKIPILNTYSEHPFKTVFDAALTSLGTNPQYCKVFAMANGSMGGHGQTRVYDGVQRTPNDYLLQYQSDIYMTAFKKEFLVMGTNFELQTLPNGNGNIVRMDRDFYRPKITIFTKIQIRPWPKLPKVFIKMEVTSVYFTSIGITRTANNMEPYDVIPGSPEDGASSLVGSQSSLTWLARSMFFGLKHPTYNTTTNKWELQKSAIKGGFGTTNAASLYTDGMHFCFVPTFSALSYNLPNTDYWHDIAGNSASTNMSRTPFDVITGQIEEQPANNVNRWNKSHLAVRNEVLGQWDNSVKLDDDSTHLFVSYDTCVDNSTRINVHMINREIGDDTLLVENRTTDWTCIYDAEKYIGVNYRSLYYAYPTATGSNKIIPGVYSKENPYVIGSGTTYFHARNYNVGINGTLAGSYSIEDINWVKCCRTNYGSKNSSQEVKGQESRNKISMEDAYFKVIPNPVQSNSMIVRFTAVEDENAQIQIVDVMGRKVYENHFKVEKDNQRYEYKVHLSSVLVNGTYFITLKNGTQYYRATIVAAQ